MKKRRTHIFYIVLFLLCIASCRRGELIVSLGLDDAYIVNRMTKLHLHPEYTGESYLWLLDGDTLSTERDLLFCKADTGTYHLTLHINDPVNPVTHEAIVVVSEEPIAFSPYISAVYDYRPAPGQFVGELPPYEVGDNEMTMREKALEYIGGSNRHIITLGAYGGYVTFGFDHSVCNQPGQFDFRLWGNAFWSTDTHPSGVARYGGACEPGIVMVSLDKNLNGLPDDEWYELAGSEYTKPQTRHHYTITYYRTPAGHQPTPHPTYSAITDTTFIRWTDNANMEGFLQRNTFHDHDYFPQWLSDSVLSFSGTCLPANAVYQAESNTYVLYAFDWGYADNAPNDSVSLNSFDIDWAVNSEGQPIHLPCIDFVRVYTAINQKAGVIGETSTELSGAADLHLLVSGDNN